jgi:hypothetical protein
MASGKAIGEFSLKAITGTHSPGPAGSVLNQVNWEGTATGFGAVFGTATYVGGGERVAVEEASAGVCQEILLRSMALRITSSLRMHAVRADLGYFPRARSWT